MSAQRTLLDVLTREDMDADEHRMLAGVREAQERRSRRNGMGSQAGAAQGLVPGPVVLTRKSGPV